MNFLSLIAEIHISSACLGSRRPLARQLFPNAATLHNALAMSDVFQGLCRVQWWYRAALSCGCFMRFTGSSRSCKEMFSSQIEGNKGDRHLVVMGRKRHFSSNENEMAWKNISLSFFFYARGNAEVLCFPFWREAFTSAVLKLEKQIAEPEKSAFQLTYAGWIGHKHRVSNNIALQNEIHFKKGTFGGYQMVCSEEIIWSSKATPSAGLI